jgi:hypothetical protein
LQDTYALATYASSQGRLEETQTLNHIHKTQDFHGPFHTPGSALFEDFCRDLVHRYCLDDIITQDKVNILRTVQLDMVVIAEVSYACSIRQRYAMDWLGDVAQNLQRFANAPPTQLVHAMASMARK